MKQFRLTARFAGVFCAPDGCQELCSGSMVLAPRHDLPARPCPAAKLPQCRWTGRSPRLCSCCCRRGNLSSRDGGGVETQMRSVLRSNLESEVHEA